MAFARKFLSLIGPDSATRFRLFQYDGGADAGNATHGAITAADYLVEDPARLRVGDVVLFRGNDNGVSLRKVTVASATSVETALLAATDIDQLDGSATWDPAEIADGASATTTITVTGAALGDFAQVSCSITQAGLSATGYVSAANTVTVVLTNNTGQAVDLGSATWRARVTRL